MTNSNPLGLIYRQKYDSKFLEMDIYFVNDRRFFEPKRWLFKPVGRELRFQKVSEEWKADTESAAGESVLMMQRRRVRSKQDRTDM